MSDKKKPTEEELKLWREFDWDEYEDETSVLIKSQKQVNYERAAQLRVSNPETRHKMSEAGKNRPPPSEETRKKLSKASKGRVMPPSFGKRSSERQKGRVFSEETKKKMSEAATERKSPHSEETIKTMKKAHLARWAKVEKILPPGPTRTPDGVYKNGKSAVKMHKKYHPNVIMNIPTLRKWCEDPDKPEYCSITWEEYLEYAK
jgi:hypothetical protein